MANEITIDLRMRVIKGGSDRELSVSDLKITMTGTEFRSDRITVPTLPGIASPFGAAAGHVPGGMFMLINRDTTNFVTMVDSGGQALMKLLPGDPQLYRPAPTLVGTTLVADHAPIDVEILSIEL